MGKILVGNGEIVGLRVGGVGEFVGAGVGVSVGWGVGVGVSVGLGVGLGVGVGHASGSVPLMKNSVPDADAIATPGVGCRQNAALIIDGGWMNDSSGLPRKNSSISDLQIGAAPTDPAILSIGVLSLLPTHTPTTILGV